MAMIGDDTPAVRSGYSIPKRGGVTWQPSPACRQGIDWARIGEWVGQRDLSTTADRYTHVLLDDTEIPHTDLL
jgi:hypothetical protein